nr:hypothetical protein CTI12_AA546800 [Tanacetum cinerariifolium]
MEKYKRNIVALLMLGQLFFQGFRGGLEEGTHDDERNDATRGLDLASKELLYFFCLKPHTQAKLDLCDQPNKITNKSVPDDQEVDVFKLLEANGPKRFLSTIKEEDVESTIDVDFGGKLDIEDEAMQTCVELDEVVLLVEKDENTKTVFSTPCDSPFFTPVGSPSRDHLESEFVVFVDENENV